QPMSRNLSSPSLTNRQHNSLWNSERTLTQNAPDRSMAGQLVEFRAGKKPTSGGSSDTEENDPMVRPYGSPSYAEVTTVTPVGKWPSTCRKRLESKSAIGRRLRRAEAYPLALRRRRDPDAGAVGERLAALQCLVEGF